MMKRSVAVLAAWLLMAPAVAVAADAATASITIKNEAVAVSVPGDGGRLSIVRNQANGRGVEQVRLCPEILNSPGLVVRSAEHKDTLGTAQAVELASEGGVQRVWVYPNLPFVFTRATLRAAGLGGRDLRNVTTVSFDVTASDKTRLFGSDGLAGAGEGKASYVFIAAAEAGSNDGVVCGFVTHDRASGIVDAKFDGGKVRVDGRSEYGLSPLNGRSEERGETFVIGLFDDARLGLEQFADVTAKVNGVKLPPAYNGYSTWYHGRATGTTGALDAKRMAELAKFADENRLDEFGLNFLQIDDQWQVQRRDFTTHKTSSGAPYPDGMKATAETINRHGFFAGLWITPFGWQGREFQDDKPNDNKTVLKDKPDWFVKRQDGSIYWVRWAGDCLDMSHPEARQFLSEVIGRMTKDWGYKLLKIDGLWAGMACKILYPSPEYRDDGLGDAVFHDKNKTNVEVYRDGLKLVREAAGKDVFLLGCNIAQNMRTMGASVGLVDAMRVGPDIKADWGAVVRCARPATWLYFWNGRVWWNDPDCLMLRDPLTVENARAWASWIALSGQMNLVSEWLPGLPPERLDIYKRTIPNHTNLSARPVDLFEREMPRVWHLSRGEGDDRVDVVGLFNWNFPERRQAGDSAAMEEPTTQEVQAAKRGEVGPVTVELDPVKLGIPGGADAALVGFDYWDKEFLAPFTGVKSVRLEPGSCKVFAIRRKGSRPQLVSTSRHISQGVADVSKVEWDAGSRVLRGRSKMVAGDPYEIRVHTAGMKMSAVKAAGKDVGGGRQDGDHLRVTLTSPESRDVEWEIKF